MNALTKVFDRVGIIGLFFRFLWKRKLYWLIPFMVVVFGFAVLFIFAQSTGLGPLIYPFI
jgi:hypothetical protein